MKHWPLLSFITLALLTECVNDFETHFFHQVAFLLLLGDQPPNPRDFLRHGSGVQSCLWL